MFSCRKVYYYTYSSLQNPAGIRVYSENLGFSLCREDPQGSVRAERVYTMCGWILTALHRLRAERIHVGFMVIIASGKVPSWRRKGLCKKSSKNVIKFWKSGYNSKIIIYSVDFM